MVWGQQSTHLRTTCDTEECGSLLLVPCDTPAQFISPKRPLRVLGVKTKHTAANIGAIRSSRGKTSPLGPGITKDIRGRPPKTQVLVGETEVNMDTARGTALIEIQPTATSEYVEKDEERRTANASDNEVSVEHSQWTPEAAAHAITTMVNYIGATDIETEAKTLCQLFMQHWRRFLEENPKMHKKFLR